MRWRSLPRRTWGLLLPAAALFTGCGPALPIVPPGSELPADGRPITGHCSLKAARNDHLHPAMTKEDLRACEAMCAARRPEGCVAAGLLKLNGRLTLADPPEAVISFAEMCLSAKYMPGCTHLGEALEAAPELVKAVMAARSAEQCRAAGQAADCDGASLMTMFPEQRAASFYRGACDAEDFIACTHLGVMYVTGGGVTPNPARAVSLFELACEGGEAEGCAKLGAAYVMGKGVLKDGARAAIYFTKACDGGYLRGCIGLAIALEGRDDGRAAALYKKACDGGEEGGCYRLGRVLALGKGIPKDEARGIAMVRKACDAKVEQSCEWLSLLGKRKACDGGDAAACFDVARDALTIDAAEVTSYLTRACEGGHLKACAPAAQMHLLGTGVPSDEARADALLTKACDGGDSYSCKSLAIQLKSHAGVAADQARAAALLTKACDTGDKSSCTTLGEALLAGDGVKKDPAAAAAAFTTACDGADAPGCYKLGQMLYHGVGVKKKDQEQAARVFKRGCNLGHQGSCFTGIMSPPAP